MFRTKSYEIISLSGGRQPWEPISIKGLRIFPEFSFRFRSSQIMFTGCEVPSRLSPAELSSDLPASLLYTMINLTSYQILGVKCECIKIILYRYFALWQMLGMYFRAQKKQT